MLHQDILAKVMCIYNQGPMTLYPLVMSWSSSFEQGHPAVFRYIIISIDGMIVTLV